MGGTVLWLMKKIGPDVAAFLDEKRQVSELFLVDSDHSEKRVMCHFLSLF